MSSRWFRAILTTSFGALLFGGAAVHAANLPPVHKSGQGDYLSGGIGKDESAAIQAASRNWPLTLEFAEKDGHHADFVADVDVVVRGASGHPALQAEATGPFMLAKLPPGRYTIDATLAGKTLHEHVTIKRGEPAHATFIWPAGVGDEMAVL